MDAPFAPQCKSQLCVRHYLAFLAAESDLHSLVTLPELNREILGYETFCKQLSRTDPIRRALLLGLSGLRSQHKAFSRQKSDLDKAITHLTEAVLLLPHQDVQCTVIMFFELATALLSRYSHYRRPGDLKSAVKYLRFLQIDFHSLEAFVIPRTTSDFPSALFHALAYNLVLTPGEMVQDLEEMMALIPKLITADILTYHPKQGIKAFSEVITEIDMFRREDTRQVANLAVQVLREATVLNPDPVIAYALCRCLAARFETTLAMNDFEEAMAILDRIVATRSPGNGPTKTQIDAMVLISVLLVSRMNFFSRPEYLEDAIHRLRAFIPRLPDDNRPKLTHILNVFIEQRFNFFGVAGSSGGTPPVSSVELLARANATFVVRSGSQESEARLQMQEKERHLKDVAMAISDGKITDVEAAVERSRKLIPLQQSRDRRSSNLAYQFADILFQAYQLTKRSDYLNEAITTYRGLHKMPASGVDHFDMGNRFSLSLMARIMSSNLQQDVEEYMQLCPELANDHSGEVFTRFTISCYWAVKAREQMHPSASIAYETAMSLLQETLILCPTLQTQHLRLFKASAVGWTIPSDYASYQIENGQVEQAIETLERGRALIWSEMRGLRTSTDQLRAANSALADKLADLNQRLESVTVSVAQSDDDGTGRREIGTGRREDSIGHLVLTQRRLLEERNSLITHIQSLPGFEHFLKPPPSHVLNSAASHGPVIIINQSLALFPSHIILLLKDSPPSIIPTASDFHDRANQLQNDLLHVRREKGLDSEDYDLTLASVLSDMYELVGKPVIERLRKLNVPETSRVWWCPTGAFCSLPLHAMGPIPSDDADELYFSDLYIPSYTPTLSALIESRKCESFSDASDNSKPSILLVAQPDTLPGAFGEINAIATIKTQVTTLISAMATPETVLEGLRDHRFAHFVCHGLLETGKPFDAALELHNGYLTLLSIVRSQLPAAEFAFLAACHTAELTEGSVADEGLHLSAALQYCGFRSVVGTMWAMADADGADLSKHFYKTLFADKADQNGVAYHERSAQALQIAVQKLRKKRGVTLERWVNFVHYGA
jgi:CHAT domain-containing protein/tetratricopeptide (TPR) repeat protein